MNIWSIALLHCNSILTLNEFHACHFRPGFPDRTWGFSFSGNFFFTFPTACPETVLDLFFSTGKFGFAFKGDVSSSPSLPAGFGLLGVSDVLAVKLGTINGLYRVGDQVGSVCDTQNPQGLFLRGDSAPKTILDGTFLGKYIQTGSGRVDLNFMVTTDSLLNMDYVRSQFSESSAHTVRLLTDLQSAVQQSPVIFTSLIKDASFTLAMYLKNCSLSTPCWTKNPDISASHSVIQATQASLGSYTQDSYEWLSEEVDRNLTYVIGNLTAATTRIQPVRPRLGTGVR